MSQCMAVFHPEGCTRCALYCLREAGHDDCHHISADLCEDEDCPALQLRAEGTPTHTPVGQAFKGGRHGGCRTLIASGYASASPYGCEKSPTGNHFARCDDRGRYEFDTADRLTTTCGWCGLSIARKHLHSSQWFRVEPKATRPPNAAVSEERT